MPENAKDTFNAALDRNVPGPLLPGLSLDKILSDVGSEMNRLAIQGRAELAQMLFTGSAYVPYGAGQSTPRQQNEQERDGADQSTPQQNEQERGGRSL